MAQTQYVSFSNIMASPAPVFKRPGTPYRFTPPPALQRISPWKSNSYTMAWPWIHSALGTKPFPKTFAGELSANFRESISSSKSQRRSFHGFEHKPETTEYTCNEDICSH